MKSYNKLFIILAIMFVAVFLTISSMTNSNKSITLNSLINQAIADTESGGGSCCPAQCYYNFDEEYYFFGLLCRCVSDKFDCCCC